MIRRLGLALLLGFFLFPRSAAAQYPVQDRLCDVSVENCRTQILDLINAETQSIDVAFWFMEDARYSAALLRRVQAGVKVRVLFDSESLPSPAPAVRTQIINDLKNAGVPIRDKTTGGILHWKLMIFGGQHIVNFSAANFSSTGYVPTQPYVNFEDEVVVFTTEASLVDTFETKYDDIWTTTTGYTDYANITLPLTRSYPTSPLDPRINFPPTQNYATRAVKLYDKENVGIDVTMYRITDARHADAMIRAVQRGVPVRLFTEQLQYRDPTRLWHSYNVDRMYMAGVQIRDRQHDGLNHQKTVVLRGQGTVIHGSSNWTTPSASQQLEHNLFTTDPTYFDFFVNQFERKWNNTGPAPETKPFEPLPPDKPVYKSPASGAINQVLGGATLKWYAGPWAQKYDIYFGPTPTPSLLVADVELGPSEAATDYVTYDIPGPLAAGTTYYWKIVSKTMANLSKDGPVWTFRTAGAPPSAGNNDIVLYAAHAPVIAGNWAVVADPTAAGRSRLANADHGVPKIETPAAAPADYFEMTFTAYAGTPYRLWFRGKAENNNYTNDSIYAQFSDSVTRTGIPTWQIGTTSATAMSVEDCSGCGLSEWGWADNGYGTAGDLVYFATSGPHTIRIQSREDGISIDQVLLSRETFLDTPPGATKNDGTLYMESDGSAATPPPPPPSTELPASWSAGDIGSVGLPGLSAYDAGTGTFTVIGSGTDIWGAADQFQDAYTDFTGDGEIVARVTGVDNVDAWTKAGVMMRDSLSAGSMQASMFISAAKGSAFQRRVASTGVSTSTAGPAVTAPSWIRMTRTGHTFTAAISADGTSWTTVGSETIVMGGTIKVGLAVTSHRNSSSAAGTFDLVTVTSTGIPTPPPPSTLPSGWSSSDVGVVSPAGSDAFNGDTGTFTVTGAGADVWDTADALHYVYTTLAGNGEISAHVATVQNVQAWTKAGVMMRDALDPGAAQASMFVSPGKGTAYQRRPIGGNISVSTAGPAVTAPYWVKLVRLGSNVAAYTSADGEGWSLIDTQEMTLGPTVDVGLAVSSHHNGSAATATFDSVTTTQY